jgi:hypothetical protein
MTTAAAVTPAQSLDAQNIGACMDAIIAAVRTCGSRIDPQRLQQFAVLQSVVRGWLASGKFSDDTIQTFAQSVNSVADRVNADCGASIPPVVLRDGTSPRLDGAPAAPPPATRPGPIIGSGGPANEGRFLPIALLGGAGLLAFLLAKGRR